MSIFSHIECLYQNLPEAAPVKSKGREKRKLETFMKKAKRLGGVQSDLEAQVKKIQGIADQINNVFQCIRVYAKKLREEYVIAFNRSNNSSDQLMVDFSSLLFKMMIKADCLRFIIKSIVAQNAIYMENLILLENPMRVSSAQPQPKPQPVQMTTVSLTDQIQRVDNRKNEFINLDRQMRAYVKDLTEEHEIAFARAKQTENERDISFSQVLSCILRNTLKGTIHADDYAKRETSHYNIGLQRLISLFRSSQQSSVSSTNGSEARGGSEEQEQRFAEILDL